MLEVRSPIAVSKPAPSPRKAQLSLSEKAPGALIQIAAWGDVEAALTPALKELGFSGLGGYQEIQGTGEILAYRTAPDRILLRHPGSLSAVAKTLDPELACSLDLSHARWVFGIEGTAGPDLLARLLPIDCTAEIFAIDHFAQSALHHVGVLLHRRAETRWELLVPVTWAQSLWDYMTDAARPLGYRIERGTA